MNNQPIITPTLLGSVSREVFLKKEHVLLGISPFNSYFSEDMITIWIRWAQRNFASFTIFIPDTLPIFTFLSLDYDEPRAKTKARRQAAYLKNKIFRALAKLGFTDKEAQNLIVDMAKLEGNEVYMALKAQGLEVYHRDGLFQSECDKCTNWVLSGHDARSWSLKNTSIAVQYVLAELPLFMNTPAILNKPSSLFAYHQTPDFIRYLYTKHSKNKLVADNQGFVALSVLSNRPSNFLPFELAMPIQYGNNDVCAGYA